MSSCEEKWNPRTKVNTDIRSLKDNTGLSSIFRKLLAIRGYRDPDKIKQYIYPSTRDLNDPDLLPNIGPAVKRLQKAIEDKEKILIFGDYDTDGIISTAILYNFLLDLNADCSYHIPDRFEEGYDISLEFIKKNNIEEKFDLIICVDCGTNALEVRQKVYSSKIGLDFIICDHHEEVSLDTDIFAEEKNNKTSNYLLINPKLKISKYPYRDLSGGGVTFKFITAVLRDMNKNIKNNFSRDFLNQLLDLVAISTISDLMPLTGENRVIVKIGLENIKNTNNRGLKKLINNIFKDKCPGEGLNTYDIGFKLAPRLNASGRLKKADESLKLLISDNTDDKEHGTIISNLESLNKQRQEIQSNTLDSILADHDIASIIREKKVFISSSSDWNEGVLGIVASDIVKKYNVPVLLFKEKTGILKGSGRSTGSFDLYANLEPLKKYFNKFGGHSQACGITIRTDKFELFKKELTRVTSKKISDEDMNKKIEYDMELDFSDILKDDFLILDEINKMEPFGIGNPKPVFLTRKCTVLSEPRFSRNTKHVFLKLKKKNIIFDAALFNYKNVISSRPDILQRESIIDILYSIDKHKNPLSGSLSVQILIKSIRKGVNGD